MPTFHNRATLTYGGETIQSNTVQGELTTALRIEKTAVNDVYRPGDAVTFAVTLRNSGAADVGDLRLSDDLGAYEYGATATLVPLEYVPGSVRYFVNGEPQAAPEVTPAPSFGFRGLRIPANGSAEVLFAARANEFAPLDAGASIVSTARLDDAASASAAQSAGALPIEASAEIRPDQSAQLRFRKSLSPEAVASGEPLTYALHIENLGAAPVPAQGGASVADRFDPPLDIQSVRYNGAEWTAAANYSYDPVGGQFTTLPGQLAVPAATFSQDAATGRWQVEPGASVIEITGTIR